MACFSQLFFGQCCQSYTNNIIILLIRSRCGHLLAIACSRVMLQAACCDNGACAETTAAQCTGSFNPKSSCQSAICSSTQGACCIAGSCQTGVSRPQCTAQGGKWNRSNKCGFCNQVQLPLGACCDISSPETCTYVTRKACLSSSSAGVQPAAGKSQKWTKGRQCSNVCPANSMNSVSTD